MPYNTLPSKEIIDVTIAALKGNNIDAHFAENAAAAKAKALEIIPAGAQVMTMTSVTGDTIGLYSELNDPAKYKPVREVLMDKNADPDKKRQLGAAPEWAVGSVHAVTQAGELLIASATGSQLPAYAYGAAHVLWVVGAQKIVKDIDDGRKRIQEHTFPLENARAMKAYGVGSGINKMLRINKEATDGRLHMILINEVIGF